MINTLSFTNLAARSTQLGNNRSQWWIFQQALFDYPWGTIIMGT
jgi:hypothetical protein